MAFTRIVNPFKAPNTNYKNHYDRSRFKLIWNMAVVLILLMLSISSINYVNPNYSVIPNLVAIGVGCLGLSVLYTTRSYRLISIICALVNLTSISITFFALKNVVHFTTPMWMMMNILFTFFMLGKNWGMAVLSIHFGVTCAYLGLRLEDNLHNLPAFKTQDLWNYIIEYIICGAGIAYIIYQFVHNTGIAEEQFMETNKELNE
ncbi:MAG: hypothetical protein JKY42_01865, partial [Flavobacteriales bacterium]|nr:hypothetical protein [Flavobacteriales bacterium]